MNKVMVCKDCGSPDVTYDTSVRWDVEAQKWQPVNDMWSPWCNICDVKSEIVAENTSRKEYIMTHATIAKYLRDGGGADIWYDFANFKFEDDDELGAYMCQLQLAMQLAANIIDPK